MIGAPLVEEPFFDYKRYATSLPSRRLGDENRKNLGKAISGFAKSEGVIIWGVDCRHTKGRRSNVHCFDHRPCCVEICRRGIGRIGSVIRRLIQSFGTSANRLTGDCHLHADDRRYDFVQNSASLAQRGTADATRERPAHRS